MMRMMRFCTALSLLCGWAESVRQERHSAQSDSQFWTRRRAPSNLPTFDSSGCAGAACGALDSTAFDFVVVGSGAGGGTVAARMAMEGHSVLVLEAGVDAGGEYEYQVPVMHATSTETPGLAWHFFVEHYADKTRGAQDIKMTSKGILYPRGGTLGGSTAVNAMINVLPKVSDWERLAALTNDNEFLPSSMNKFERILDSWLPKENPSLVDLLGDIFKPNLSLGALRRLLGYFDAAIKEMGIENETLDGDFFDAPSKLRAYARFLLRNVNDKLRQGNIEGSYGFPQMIKNGNRHGTREHLMQALGSGKLTIKTGALVSKVVFENVERDGSCKGPCRAKEVLYLDGRGLYGAEMNPSSKGSPGTSRVMVRKGGEIILSGGAFNTPQILKQSGIGSREELKRFGIPVHVDLVGVGENLQDRYEVTVESQVFDKKTNEPLPFVNPRDCNYQADEKNDLCFRHWSQKNKGLYATNGAVLAMLKRSGMTDPSDLHIFGLPGPFRGYAPGYSAQIPLTTTRNYFSWVILKGHTDNRGGTVRLRCARQVSGKCVVDPRATPDINFHYFDEGVEYDELNTSLVDSKGERDLTAVVRAVELVRRIQDRTSKSLNMKETWPGDNFAPGEDFSSESDRLREWIKRDAWGHHASCTAPMGCIPSKEVGAHNAGAGVCAGGKFNKNTVLDSRFRVRGTQGLRVVDASAWPRIPGTFLLLPTFMLSEKAAATILEDQQ